VFDNSLIERIRPVAVYMMMVEHSTLPTLPQVVFRELVQDVDRLLLHYFGRRELLVREKGSHGQLYIPCYHHVG
jgi:hypothetical protein